MSPSSRLAPGTVQIAAVVCEAGHKPWDNREKFVINNNNLKKRIKATPLPPCVSIYPLPSHSSKLGRGTPSLRGEISVHLAGNGKQSILEAAVEVSE